MDNWITDTEISTRFPYYTRANADEVGPDPFTPLGWSLGWVKGCIPGVAGGFVEFGVLERDEFALDPPEVFGNWGGYFYNQLSLPRTMGTRMPGASPEAIDQAYFGDHPGVPPIEAHPSDENEAATAKLGESMAWAMSTDGFPQQDAVAQEARDFVAGRPDLGQLNNGELVARAREAASKLDASWVQYCQSCLGASLGPGAVGAICEAIGRSEDAVKVMAAIGDVESAEASFLMWDLSRMVRNSAELSSLFDQGIPAVEQQMVAGHDANTDTAKFLNAWMGLMADHGHRGPNEWDMGAPSWTTRPSLALGMIERMRLQDDERSPQEARSSARANREALTAELLAMVEGDAEAHGTLQAGINSASVFFQLREKGKNACIRLLHEGKLAMLEVGGRLVAEGHLDDAYKVFMVLDTELDSYLSDPGSMTTTINERHDALAKLHTLEPPYIIKLQDGVPPISEWKSRNAATSAAAEAGETLQGAAGAPGHVTGIARVILDPSDPSAIGPGDIMIAPTTDPSWTPLFLAAEGVVVNVGAVASHAAIVCRELGVPCAVSVVDATNRIPDGATITLDGSTGAVTVVTLP